jgi:hypothetical protein
LVSAKLAKDKIWGVREKSDFCSAANAMNDKHGNRKSRVPMRGWQKDQNRAIDQLFFKFDDNGAP